MGLEPAVALIGTSSESPVHAPKHVKAILLLGTCYFVEEFLLLSHLGCTLWQHLRLTTRTFHTVML